MVCLFSVFIYLIIPMNTLLRTIACLLFLTYVLYSSAQNFTIDYPIYQNRNSEALEISRIERNDTATILYMDAYSLSLIHI